jgi:hypothetical protein
MQSHEGRPTIVAYMLHDCFVEKFYQRQSILQGVVSPYINKLALLQYGWL